MGDIIMLNYRLRLGGRAVAAAAIASALVSAGLLTHPVSAQASLRGSSQPAASHPQTSRTKASLAQASRPKAGLPGASTLLTRAPYLTDLTSSSVQLTWATTTQSRGVVEYGPAGSCTAHSLTAAKLGSPITVNGVKEYQNSVPVTSLSASTSYCYRITTGGSSPVDLLGSNSSPRFSTLQTASGSKPLTFDVTDDWGDTTNSGVNSGAVNANQASIDSEIAGSGAQFMVSIGDIAYQEGTQTNYGDLNQTGHPYVSDVFAPSYWAKPGQDIPVFQGDGDHGQTSTILGVWPETATAKMSSGEDAMVSYPAAGGRTTASYPTQYYAFSAGGVRFYVLDAAWGDANQGSATGGSCGGPCTGYQVDQQEHWTPSSAEYRWLKNDLAMHHGGLKFAFFHFPLYSDDATEPTDSYLDAAAGSTGSLEQLLHDNGVDLAFTGHAHDYQRNIAVPGGVTSYVTGGGGGKVIPIGGHGCASTDAYGIGWNYASGKGTACGAAAKPTTDAQVYHFLKVTVNGSSVTVSPTDAQNNTFDTQTYNFAPDTTPPSAPGSLAATQPTPTSTALTWTAATDNIGVTGYDIYRNGTYLATVGPSVTRYTDATASANIGYTYQVSARDLAGNTTSATVAVNGGSSSDTTPPTAPGSLQATATTGTQVNLSWTASTDNVGVARYDIVRNGSVIGFTTGTTYADDNVSPAVSYSYQVVAYDAAGNASAPSSTVKVTTPAGASVFSDGFETGDLSKWSTVSGLTVQSTLVHTGSYAARETSTGSPAYAYATLPGGTDLQAQAWVDVSSRSTAANLFGFGSTTGGSIVNVYLSTTGKLALRNNVGKVTTTSATGIPAGWHLVSLHAIIGTSGSLAVSLDGTPVPGLTLTGQNLGTRSVNRFQLGDTSTARSYDIALDDVNVVRGGS